MVGVGVGAGATGAGAGAGTGTGTTTPGDGGGGGGEADPDPDDDADIARDDDDYKVWKKHVPLLYELVVTHALEWSSQTVQWFRELYDNEEKQLRERKILLGTITGQPSALPPVPADPAVPPAQPVEDTNNYLVVAKVKLPHPNILHNAAASCSFSDLRGEYGGYQTVAEKVETFRKIRHDGDINSARYMPQDTCKVATKSSPDPVVKIFDTALTDSDTPSMMLTGHTQEGFSLSWSNLHRGELLSGAQDHSICSWDIEGGTTSPKIKIDEAHTDTVEDVSWHPKHGSIFGSVGDDKALKIWDSRTLKQVKVVTKAHLSDIHSIAFNPQHEFLFATSSADSTVALWDLRNLSSKLHTLVSHTAPVFPIAWSNFNSSVLASGSQDRRVHIWDLSHIGDTQTPLQSVDGPPELIFIHCGHIGAVTDIAWDWYDPWLIASVAEGNMLQIWKMSEQCINACYSS
ncbi:histone-binding protein RBBP7 [Pelomyxa schiedti]|nr:histone-binding protein RBBP7 [Pelomyxa schiedti]